MVVAAVVVGVAAVGSAVASNQQAQAAKGASAAAERANAANNDLSQSAYDQTRADYAPYNEAGTAAVNRLNAASSGDTSAFTTSPGYAFRLGEGQKAQQNSFAARGGALSGNALKALAEYNQNFASNEYGTWWDQQQGLANTGANAVAGVANASANNVAAQTTSNTNTANRLGDSYYQQGNARASGVMGVTNALSMGLSNYGGGSSNSLYSYTTGRTYRPNGSYYYGP